jgi:hypothetical protein
LSLVFGLLLPQSLDAQRLFAYFPSTIRPQAIQNDLSDAVFGLEVVVFGRFRDFAAQVESERPDAVLTLPAVLEQLPEYKTLLHGVRNGRRREQYVLVSVSDPLNPDHLAGKTIGIIDFLGRRKTEQQVSRYFEHPPHLKRVTRVEDFVPLLSFGMADGVFLSRRHADYMRETSNLPYRITPVPTARLGILALAARSGSLDRTITKSILNLPDDVLAALGIEKWK